MGLFLTSFAIAKYSFYICEKQNLTDLNPIESIIFSIVDETSFYLKKVDIEKEKDKLEKFEDDGKQDIQPNIICILNESFSDISKVINIKTNKDPFESFKKLESKNCKIGTVSVNSFGGGTSKSEWEFLTGLDVEKFSDIQIPFLGKTTKNYAFTSNKNLYSDYEKTFIHPYAASGWNRINVYNTFKYDNLYFYDDEMKKDAIFLDLFVSDKYLYDKTLNILKENNSPQFVKIVTMQNHGGYVDRKLPDIIKIENEIKNKIETEDFLTLMYYSSESIAELIHYLEKNKEEPTIIIMYGDHLPGGLFDERGEEAFKTPYLVYSNFCELNDMPEHMDLSLLYPNAKAAAGLPMTAYEKYLISLNGETVDSDFIVSRMKYGAFELEEDD